jgi:hypothetical protein
MTKITTVRRRQGGISPLAPAYYQGRSARVWYEALRPRRSPTPIPATPSATTPAAANQSNTAGVTQSAGGGPSPAGFETAEAEPCYSSRVLDGVVERRKDTAPTQSRPSLAVAAPGWIDSHDAG